MIKKLYLLMIELFWIIEHLDSERIGVYGYRQRKTWERKYCSKFNENIYGEKL